MLGRSPYLPAVLLTALVCLGASASIAQTDPTLGTGSLQVFRSTVATSIELQPPATLGATYSLQWGSQGVGRNAIVYTHGYTTPAELRLTNSSTTANHILRMSDDDPPVPGWYPRHPNIWVTSGGNPIGGASYTSAGTLGSEPAAGSQWFGTTDAWPLELVAGLATALPPNNLVRGVMSADGVLSLDSALLVSLFPTATPTNLVAITNDSVPTSMMVRSQGSIRIRDINTNSGTLVAPIPGIWKADSNTVFGARILSGSNPRTQLNTLMGAQAFLNGLVAGQAGNHPTTGAIYFSGIRNTAMGYLSGRNSIGGLGAYFGSNTMAVNTTNARFVGEVAFGSSALSVYWPSGVSTAARFVTAFPANPAQIAPITSVGARSLMSYNQPSSLMPYHVALGSEALMSTVNSRGNIALGQRAGMKINTAISTGVPISDALYVTRDSVSNPLLVGALLRGRLIVNAPASVFNVGFVGGVPRPSLDPNDTDVGLFVYANADSDQDGNPDPTPLDQYTVPGTTIQSPSTMDPTLRLTVPDVLPPNMNDDATRGVRTAGTTVQVIDGNRAPAVGATLPAWVDNQWIGYRVLITSGAQAGQIREITANTGNVLTVAPAWSPAIAVNSKYAILPSLFETERPAAGNVQYTAPTFQVDLQGNVHMRPYGVGVGEDAAFGQVTEMRLYDLTNFESGSRSGGTATTLIDATKNWPTNFYTNAIVRIIDGAGAGQTRRITSNTATQLTVSASFSGTLNATTRYEIEIVSEVGIATTASATVITDVSKNWSADFLDFTGAQVRIIAGTGAGQTRTIVSSTNNSFTVYPQFTTTPVAGSSVYEISRWFPRYVGFRAANDVPNPSWNVFMNLPNPTAIPAGARYALTVTNDAPLTMGWVGVGSMAFPHTWDNKSADIGESIDVSPLFGWPAAGYPFGSTGAAEQSIIMGTKLTLNGPPNVPFANRVPQANFNTGFGFDLMNALDNVADAGDSNTAVGHRVLNALTTGQNNVALGKDALRLLTTGSDNVAIGVNSLTSLVTGSRSVAVGANALRSSVATTGANTAIGDSAMASLTTGSDNSAIGWLAMRAATTANSNTVIGDSAAYQLTTGRDNVIVGARSAPSLTTGRGNVVMGRGALANGQTDSTIAIGEGALRSFTTGINNVAIGRFAMENSVNVSLNIAIGDSTLRNAETGDTNIAIGRGSLISLTTGDKNIAIGDSAMPLLTTGSENVAVGRRALREVVTASGNLALGNDALRLLTTGTDNIAAGVGALTTVTSGSNNVGIGLLALSSLTDGANFIAMGDSAMLNTTTGTGHSIALGSRALRSMVTTSGVNIAVGSQALYSVTSTFDNISIGNFALHSLTSGAGRNIAIGNNALRSLATGTENVAIGDSALFFNRGSFNVAVGNSALRSLDNEFAYGNVAVGTSAMWSARGASYNVAVGDSALTSLTEGWGNVAVGGASLVSSTLTYDNTAVGDSALASNSIGRDNVAIGRRTMAGVGTGPMFANVAVGEGTMASHTAGYGNTAIGKSALRDLSTGGELDSGNVALGNLAGARAPAGTKNALFIANTEGTALLFGQFGAGRLMINATLPIGGPLPILDAALQVNPTTAATRGVVVRMAAAPTISPFIIQDDLEATRFEIQTSGAFPSVNGVAYTWPGAAPAAAAVGTQTGRATIASSSAGVLTFQQLTSTVTTDPLDLPVVLANASADIVVPNAVAGAAPGDVVSLGVPNAAANLNLVSYQAWVSANDQVTIRVSNFSANALVALDDQVFKIVVVK